MSMIKSFLHTIAFIAIIILAHFASAEKLIVTKHDEFVDTKTNFFDGEGQKVYLDQFEGSTILLVFWATWCGACVDELASLDVLQKDFRKLPFKVIAVSQDYNGVEVVKKHFAENEIRYLSVYHDYQNKLFKALSISGLPTAYLINQEGKLKYIFNGIVKWQDEDVREMILAEIEGNPSLPKNTFTEAPLNKQITKQMNIQTNKPKVETKIETAPPVNTNNKEVKDEENNSRK